MAPPEDGGFERWWFAITTGPLVGRDLHLSFRTDLPGSSMAFVEDEHGLVAQPYVTIIGTEDERERFRDSAELVSNHSTVWIELELERPSSMADLLPYTVKQFRYTVQSGKRAPHGKTMH